MQEEKFNLDREMNIERNVDPNGRKWNIFHIRGSSLYEARPEPYRKDFQCPEEFEGRWTKPALLQSQINLYLNRAWDAAEKAAQKNERKAQAAKESKRKQAKKQTPKESLDSLPQEIKDELKDELAKEDEK